MQFKEFFNEHKPVIIVVVVIIVLFIIYKYYWAPSPAVSIGSVESRLDNLETNMFKQPRARQNPDSPNQVCLNTATQQKIISDINKKLQEINACDCKDTCATNTKS
jgi:hypothetical protein